MPERLKKFLKLHDELRDKVPDSVECARKLAEFVGDPKAEDPEEIWRVLWDKPLYANVSVNVADDWKAQIGPWMEGAWLQWGGDTDEFRIRRNRLGKKYECFEVVGRKAREIIKRHESFPLVRLYAIQGAAAVMLSYRRLFANLPEFPLVPEISIRELEDQLGWRWGHTTVMHALTDVGLSVKPDRQLARTVKALNLVPGVPKGVAPTRTEAVKINHGVSDLLDGIRSAGRTDIPDGPRYIDKVLMEISSNKLLRECPGQIDQPH